MTTTDSGQISRLNDIGIALSAEHDIERLLEMILQKAKDISNADAGILFTHHEKEDVLIQRVRHCDSLDIHVGGTTGEPTYGRPVELYDVKGHPLQQSVTAYCSLSGKSVNIEDIYEHHAFDSASTKAFDMRRKYRTKSVLAVPMVTKRKHVIGVIRLSNAQDKDGNIIPFSDDVLHLVESLASQGAVALDNDLLIAGLADLLESLIQLVAKAVDQKSSHTGNHLQKIPIIMDMLVEGGCRSNLPPFDEFDMTEEQKYEVRIAAWLHDCGKLTTPDYLLEKSTKLETFFDRIELIRTRLEVVARDIEIAQLKGEISAKEAKNRLTNLQKEWPFLSELNQGSEWVEDEKISRLEAIANYQWKPIIGNKNVCSDIAISQTKSFFTEDEWENLNVRRGTLTAGNRKIVQDHILHSIDMLEQMPFPRQLRRVPEYAGGHHERIDGKGYPKGLKGEDMSLPARMMAVADVFEALTSHDRPYKSPKTLSETYHIMKKMRDGGAIDPDVFELLWQGGVYKRYATRYLKPEQIDEVVF